MGSRSDEALNRVPTCSCRPNVAHALNARTGQYEARTTEAVAAGEELCISYLAEARSDEDLRSHSTEILRLKMVTM